MVKKMKPSEQACQEIGLRGRMAEKKKRDHPLTPTRRPRRLTCRYKEVRVPHLAVKEQVPPMNMMGHVIHRRYAGREDKIKFLSYNRCSRRKTTLNKNTRVTSIPPSKAVNPTPAIAALHADHLFLYTSICEQVTVVWMHLRTVPIVPRTLASKGM